MSSKWRVIRIPEEAYFRLLTYKAKLSEKEGRVVSFGEAILRLLNSAHDPEV